MTKTALPLLLILLLAAGAQAANRADLEAGMEAGTPKLKSADALAFGPNGILFVGDSQTATLFALDTEDDASAAKTYQAINVPGIDGKIAALVGSTADQVRIHDLAVNPASGRVYVSASRGQGPEAVPIILRVDPGGALTVQSLEDVKFAQAALPNPPDPNATRRGRSLRSSSITDLAYVDQSVLVTGLSNEEFSSKLRVVPFPFDGVDSGTSIEIFHGAHGRWETYAPVRTFARYDIDQEPHVLAAYTCTPLVKFPVSELKAGVKLVGTTVAELGNRNRPLDMIVYQKNGKDYLLMANSSRGVMKVDLAEVDSIEGITERIDGKAGLPYDTIAALTGVEQLDLLDPSQAVLLVKADGGGLDLKTIALP